jgi:hypothetical protein
MVLGAQLMSKTTNKSTTYFQGVTVSVGKIVISYLSAIFRRNSIINPGSNDQIENKKKLFRFLYPVAVPGYGIKLFDS